MFVSKLAKRQADTTQTTTQDTVDTGEIRHNASIPTTINPLSSILNIVSHAKKPAEPSPIQHVAPTLQNGPVGFVLQGTNLKYFNKVIPDPLRARFFDIRALYSQPLYDYLSKKKKHPGNISMKLKHLGIDARGIKLYIVIQCEKRVSKKVKKFFLQENVADDLSPDFLVLVLDKPPVEIANEDAIDVLSNSVPDKTICGMPITLIGGGKSVSCTLGGTIIATTDQRRIYGLIAGHPLKKLRGDSSGKQPTYEVPGSTLEDEEEDSDSDETSTDTSVTSLESLHSDIETTNADDRLREKHHIGTVVYDSFNTQSGKNYDWALVDLRQEYALPNVAPQNRHANDSYFGKEFYRNHAGSFSTVFTEQVLVLKPDKPQMAELFLNNSSLVMSPGCKFVHVHDVVMKDGSSLSPGDSGLWVLDAKTLCLYGHIVSVDAFGETQVMPIHSTFQSIAWELEATEVYLPTSKDIQSLKAPRELSLSFTQPEPPAPVSKLTPASINRKTQKFDHEPDDAA